MFRLVCEAQGEPAPDVFWTRENRDKIVVTDKKSGRRSTGQCGQGMLTIGATMDDIDNLHYKDWNAFMYVAFTDKLTNIDR